jgi:hypothetical protein
MQTLLIEKQDSLLKPKQTGQKKSKTCNGQTKRPALSEANKRVAASSTSIFKCYLNYPQRLPYRTRLKATFSSKNITLSK